MSEHYPFLWDNDELECLVCAASMTYLTISLFANCALFCLFPVWVSSVDVLLGAGGGYPVVPPEHSSASGYSVSPHSPFSSPGSDGSKTVPSSSFDAPDLWFPLCALLLVLIILLLTPPHPEIHSRSLALVRDPASIVYVSRTSDQIIEKMKQQPGSPVALPNKPQQPRDVAKSSESSLPRTDINPNMLSVETFRNHLGEAHGVYEGAAAPRRLYPTTGCHWVLVTQTLRSARNTNTPKPDSESADTPWVTLSGDREPMRAHHNEDASPQRGRAERCKRFRAMRSQLKTGDSLDREHKEGIFSVNYFAMSSIEEIEKVVLLVEKSFKSWVRNDYERQNLTSKQFGQIRKGKARSMFRIGTLEHTLVNQEADYQQRAETSHAFKIDFEDSGDTNEEIDAAEKALQRKKSKAAKRKARRRWGQKIQLIADPKRMRQNDLRVNESPSREMKKIEKARFSHQPSSEIPKEAVGDGMAFALPGTPFTG
eukprot:gene5458-3936_t